MTSPLVIAKVSYAGVLRQIILDDAQPRWTEFEAQIRRIHGIPTSTLINVTYKDQDGDVISLDTDAELSALLREAQVWTTSGRTVVRFEVRERDGESTGFVVVGDEVGQQQEQVAKDGVREDLKEDVGKSVDHESTGSQSVDVNDHGGEDTTSQSRSADSSTFYPSPEGATDKGKAPETAGSSSTTPEPSSSSASSSSSAPQNPFEQFANNIKPILEQMQANIEAHPDLIKNMGELFGQIGEQAKVHAEPMLKNLHEQFLNGGCPLRPPHAPSPPTPPEAPRHPPFPFDFRGFPFQFGSPANNWPFVPPRRDAPTPSAEDIKKKVETLNGMGFWDNALNEELLRRYEGNVERVVEVLLRK